MAGSKKNWSGKELREFGKEHMPKGTITITRKPTNGGAGFILPNGKIIQAHSNFGLVDIITSPKKGKKIQKEKFPRLIEIAPEANIKTWAENEAVKALGHLIELRELLGEKPRIVYDEEGIPCRIKTSIVEYNLHGLSVEIKK